MLTSIQIRKPEALERIQRDPVIPLTRITVFAGPNGSGKSTAVDTVREYFFARPGTWTDENALVNIEGSCLAVFFVSSEMDNPRLHAKRDAQGHQMHAQMLSGFDVALGMMCQGMSHGQSNYFLMEDLFKQERFDVIVLDEPENALDLDGLGWLHKQIRKTTKQVIVVTHNPLLLALKDTPEGSVQVFGSNPDYASRVQETYSRVIGGRAFGKLEKRMHNKSVWKAQRPSKRTGRRKGTFSRD